jgi:hypothetical protein
MRCFSGTTTVGERSFNALRVTSDELTLRKVCFGLEGKTGPEEVDMVRNGIRGSG